MKIGIGGFQRGEAAGLFRGVEVAEGPERVLQLGPVRHEVVLA